MEKVLTTSIEYLITTNNEEWQYFLEAFAIETDPDICIKLKKGIATLYTPLLQDIAKLKLVAFPRIKYYSNLDKKSLKPYFDYFNDEQKSLLSIKKLLKANTQKLNSDLPIISTCGILCHAIGESHSENTIRLTREIEFQNMLNNGVDVSIPESSLETINHPLIREINTSCKQLLKKSNP